MPEFKETPSGNPDQPPLPAELLAQLKNLDLGREYRESIKPDLSYQWSSPPENQELSEPTENLNEPEVAPSFVSSEERLTHLLDEAYGRKGIDRFKKLVSDMSSAAISEQDKEDIRHFGEYHLWAMGEHEGTPPESVVVVRDEYSSLLTVEPNPQVFTDADEDRILKKHNAEGEFLQDIHWKRVGHLQGNRDKIVDGLAEIVADSPAYKFLESLTIGNPHSPEDRPLNIFEQAVRQSQAEQNTKRQFGMSANDNVKHNPNAARALQRQNFSIDEERVTAKSIQHADGSPEPIRSYFVDVMRRKIADDWEVDFGDEPVDLSLSVWNNIAFGPKNSEFAIEYSPDVIIQDISETFESEGLDARLDRQVVQETLNALTKGWDFESADQMLYYVRRTAAASVFVDATTAHSAPHLTRSLSGIKVYDRENYDSEEKVHNQYRKALENSEERILDWNFGLYDHGSGFSEASTSGFRTNENSADFNVDDSFRFKDHESMEDDKRRIAGNVIGFQPDGARRLIQVEAKNPLLPPVSGDADITYITDNSSGFSNQQPQIPGYTLIGRTENVYEFVEADNPYRSCDVEISLANRETLAEEYRALGLDNLSREVMRGEQFTVSNLAAVIKNHGNYFTPSAPVLISDNPDFSDFQDFVDDEKLQLQCSGAGHFLKLSLNRVFGEDSSEVISGLSFDSNGQVSLGSAHAQTGFEHDGRKYILDATPSSELTVARELAHIPETIVERTAEERLEQQFNRLEEQLCSIFKAPDVLALHTHLSALSDHDPARRTLEVLAGLKSSQDTDDCLEYIDSIKQAALTKDPRLKQLGIGQYSVKLLDLLSGQIRRAQGLLAQMGR